MDIVVLDYSTGSVEIYKNIDDEYIEREYGGDIEEYLCEERDYSGNDCYWMAQDKLDFIVYAGKDDKCGVKV